VAQLGEWAIEFAQHDIGDETAVVVTYIRMLIKTIHEWMKVITEPVEECLVQAFAPESFGLDFKGIAE
jgi:hypothetical protein